jgi:adenosylmethionine-8-amino-7-oxononanoate aminotransferase
MMAAAVSQAEITADRTSVFPRYLDWAYPNIERAEGVRLYRTDGGEILDACGGGAMVACLGHGRHDLAEAAARQAEELSRIMPGTWRSRLLKWCSAIACSTSACCFAFPARLQSMLAQSEQSVGGMA